MSISASEQLTAEAHRLSLLVRDDSIKMVKLGSDVIQLLASQEVASTNRRVREIIQSVRKNNALALEKGSSLRHNFDELMRACGNDVDFYGTRRQEIRSRSSLVDRQKPITKELLDLIAQAHQTVENTPKTIRLLMDSAAIVNFSQAFNYIDLLNAFLQYPTTYRRTLDVAGNLAKAVALDLAGKAIPFLGTITAMIDTVFDLMEPRFEKKMEELRQATTVFDRVCDFDDQLTELLEYVDFAEEYMRFADQTSKTTRASFTIDSAWFSAVLGNAAST
jgi:hypothetical protein